MVKYYDPLSDAEKNNKTNFFISGAAGILSGLIKVPEGVFSLAAELFDLGADTNTAASVEEFFDKLNPFEEVAEERAIGKLTEAFTQIGIPGGVGFKLGQKIADKALKAKKSGNLLDLKNPNLQKSLKKTSDLNNKAGYKRFAAGVMGGATGEAFVADIEKIGTFGDMLGGPTKIDREEGVTNRGEALRKLLNRVRFSSEGVLITPFVYGVGKGAKELALRGKDLAYSDSQFLRLVDKLGGAFRARGRKPQEVFEAKMKQMGRKMGDAKKAESLSNYMTQQIDEMFPTTQRVFDKSLQKEKDQFLAELDEVLFKGNLRNKIDQTSWQKITQTMKDKKVPQEKIDKMYNAITNSRGAFVELLDFIKKGSSPDQVKTNVKELEEIMGDRVKQYLGNTYKIFNEKSILPFANYEPTDEAINRAVRLFQRYSRFTQRNNKTVNEITEQEGRAMVAAVLDSVPKTKPKGQLPAFKYVNLTAGAETPDVLKTFARTVTKGKYAGGDPNVPKVIGRGSKVFRELFGEIQDPRYSVFNAMTKLSAMARKTQFFGDLLRANNAIPKDQRRFFYGSKNDAIKNLPNQEIVSLDDYVRDTPGVINPLKGSFTSKDIAEGIGNSNNVSAFFRGEREGASLPEKIITWGYRNMILFPKGLSQIAKTVLSIPTHLRNVFSAGAFAGANGTLFENPALIKEAFEESFGALQVGTRSEAADKAYQELLELGVVNSQVQIGDLMNLLRDVKFGEGMLNTDNFLRPMLNKLKKGQKFFQDLYVAEDDLFKIYNYAIERKRLAKAYGTSRTTQQIKEEAADIVRNTVPNYAYVSDTVRALRVLPFGNFMSFPSEILRTSTNIVERALKEIKDPVTGSLNYFNSTNPLKGIGLKRIAGMATTTVVVPTAVAEGARALYDITEDELKAMRRFLPEWSQNSTIVPIRKENGDLMYVDFSHGNAYDTLARPFVTLLNNIQKGEENEKALLDSFVRGSIEAFGEISDPFISESIFTEAMNDIWFRGGRTQDGRQLYTEQTAAGDKLGIQIRHLATALAPSYKQFVRIGLGATDTVGPFLGVGRRGEEYRVLPEVAGFFGFRGVDIKPLDSMGFKITGYQKGIRNARREFTGGAFGVLSGGKKKPNDVIERFIASNRARFNVQKEMYRDLKAAQLLGVSNTNLKKEFKERQLSDDTYNALNKGVFKPYFPSADIQARFQEISRNIGEPNPFRIAFPTLQQLRFIFNNLRLDFNFDKLIEPGDYLLQDAPAPIAAPQIPQSGAVIAPPPRADVIPTTGLTATETALLSPEEQIIRQRTRT
tara:strand:- start:1533 stop:5414 length:3882 start_codon:yes stop_codon:yes gene_type:complete